MTECPSTIAGLQQAISQGQITAEQAIERQRVHLLRADQSLHAVVDVVPCLLMHPGKQDPLAGPFAGPFERPLAGVGLAHKDIFNLPGQKPGLGCGRSEMDLKAPGLTAATVIERLSRSGATDLATLAMAEYACGATGDNPHIARCINPLHADAVVGGSSSGSAVAVACGMVYGSLGTDTAGSVRIPAATCGVLGLKTTHRLLPLDGVFPLAPSLDGVGVLARTADDARRILQACCDSSRLRPEKEGRAAAWIPDTGVDDVVADAMQALASQFGMFVMTTLDSHVSLTQLAEIVLHAEAAQTHRDALLACTLSPAVKAIALPGLVMPGHWLEGALVQRARQVRDFVCSHLHAHDILVIPAIPAPIPDWQKVTPGETAFDVRQLLALYRYMGFINYLGLPALTVPVALDTRGLPISVQLVGRPFQELTLLRFAAQIESLHFRMADTRLSFSPND